MQQLFLEVLTGRGVLLPLAVFLSAGMLVFAVAARLAQHADVLADVTGLGRLWTGSLLLSASTSMPEIITDINAAAFGVPDIGVGDLFGSTLANMLILALLVTIFERRQLLRQAALDHALVGTLAIVLTATAGFSIVSGGFGSFAGVGFDSAVIVLVYVAAMRAVFDLTQRAANAPRAETTEPPRTLVRHAMSGFAVATLGLVLTAPLLVFSADALAAEAGVSDTFVGTFLVGLTTSCPELAAAVAAVRLGAVDLAVGNLFGSNAFNMTILLLMDLAYRDAPLLAVVSKSHVITATAAVIALALGVMAILARTHNRTWVGRLIAALILVIYAQSLVVLGRTLQ